MVTNCGLCVRKSPLGRGTTYFYQFCWSYYNMVFVTDVYVFVLCFIDYDLLICSCYTTLGR